MRLRGRGLADAAVSAAHGGGRLWAGDCSAGASASAARLAAPGSRLQAGAVDHDDAEPLIDLTGKLHHVVVERDQPD